MRRIGTIADKARARQFADHLFGLGIENEVEPDGEAFAVWVHDEDQLAQAAEELAAFEANPADPRFADTARQGRDAWRDAEQQARDARARTIDMRTAMAAQRAETMPVFTMALIGFSAFVFYLQQFVTPETHATEAALMISARTDAWFPEVKQGELWRLFTPMFLHFGFIHILFNMMWTWDLGGVLERVHGIVTFASMVIVFSLGGNLLQYLLVGPGFGGMSGVVFGLLGFMWMKTVWDPRVPYQLPMTTVWLMGIWFVVCWTGAFGPIANWAHTGGLLGGMVWGALSSPRFRRRLGMG
jgi:GlpG protein